MIITKCEKINGMSFNPIPGQARYYYSLSSFEDFYDMIGWMERGGYKGSTISFFDIATGRIETPFERKRNIIFSRPVCENGELFFIEGDFNNKTITLFKYAFGGNCDCLHKMSMDGVELYNLSLCGYPVHIVSQKDKLVSYYPEAFEITLNPNESLEFIENGKVYLSAWIEEGIVDEVMTEDYRFYNKWLVKDYCGNLISEEVGCIDIYPDGKWRVT